jgi:putative CocE/NonD family hydrolase
MPWGSRLGGHELGPEAGPAIAHAAFLAFLDRVLKGRGEPPLDRIRYFTGGIGWRTASRWPVPHALITGWNAVSGGRANGRHGDGRLMPAAAGADPGPFDLIAAEPLVAVPGGLEPLSDEGATEDRRDVLCYTSDVLGHDVVITGQPLVVVTSVADTRTHDLVASLTMVDPSGRSTRLATGARRCRGLVPGQAAESIIELGPISWLVPTGHRLRLDVTASRFPAYDRNPQNDSIEVHRASRDDCRVALIEIHAARLELPVE